MTSTFLEPADRLLHPRPLARGLLVELLPLQPRLVVTPGDHGVDAAGRQALPDRVVAVTLVPGEFKRPRRFTSPRSPRNATATATWDGSPPTERVIVRRSATAPKTARGQTSDRRLPATSVTTRYRVPEAIMKTTTRRRRCMPVGPPDHRSVVPPEAPPPSHLTPTTWGAPPVRHAVQRDVPEVFGVENLQDCIASHPSAARGAIVRVGSCRHAERTSAASPMRHWQGRCLCASGRLPLGNRRGPSHRYVTLPVSPQGPRRTRQTDLRSSTDSVMSPRLLANTIPCLSHVPPLDPI